MPSCDLDFHSAQHRSPSLRVIRARTGPRKRTRRFSIDEQIFCSKHAVATLTDHLSLVESFGNQTLNVMSIDSKISNEVDSPTGSKTTNRCRLAVTDRAEPKEKTLKLPLPFSRALRIRGEADEARHWLPERRVADIEIKMRF